jgi:maltodextrin utilization protein YvdJ|tara:strand:+ start:223 stop:522 length:300 start_codon:yes stop_codon:yes gene_type:complete
MSIFQIDTEMDKLIDKLTDQFKTRLKKLVLRSEKLVLKQYIASQKETMRATRKDHKHPPKPKVKPKPKTTRTQKTRRQPVCEKDYQYEEFASSSDESDH